MQTNTVGSQKIYSWKIVSLLGLMFPLLATSLLVVAMMIFIAHKRVVGKLIEKYFCIIRADQPHNGMLKLIFKNIDGITKVDVFLNKQYLGYYTIPILYSLVAVILFLVLAMIVILCASKRVADKPCKEQGSQSKMITKPNVALFCLSASLFSGTIAIVALVVSYTLLKTQIAELVISRLYKFAPENSSNVFLETLRQMIRQTFKPQYEQKLLYDIQSQCNVILLVIVGFAALVACLSAIYLLCHFRQTQPSACDQDNYPGSQLEIDSNNLTQHLSTSKVT